MGNVPVGQLEMDIGRPPELIKRSNLRSEMWGTGKFWSSTEKALLTESKRTGSCMNSEFLNLQSLQEELVSMIRGYIWSPLFIYPMFCVKTLLYINIYHNVSCLFVCCGWMIVLYAESIGKTKGSLKDHVMSLGSMNQAQ